VSKTLLEKEEMVTMGGFPFGMIRSLTLENQFTKNGFLAQKIAVGFMTRLPEVLPQSMYIFKQPLVGGEVTSHQELTKWRFVL